MGRQKRDALIISLSILVIMGVGAVIAVTVSGGSETHEELAYDSSLPEPAGGFYIITGMGYAGMPSIGEAARRADLIAVATVSDKLPAFWTTRNGERPEMSEEELARKPSIKIFTPYQLDIKLALKGEPPEGGRIILNRLGGQIDKDIMVYEDDIFSFTPGTDVVVFLRDCGNGAIRRFGSPGARYIIISRYVLDEDGEPLISITYDELVEIIEREGTLEAKGGIVPC